MMTVKEYMWKCVVDQWFEVIIQKGLYRVKLSSSSERAPITYHADSIIHDEYVKQIEDGIDFAAKYNIIELVLGKTSYILIVDMLESYE